MSISSSDAGSLLAACRAGLVGAVFRFGGCDSTGSNCMKRKLLVKREIDLEPLGAFWWFQNCIFRRLQSHGFSSYGSLIIFYFIMWKNLTRKRGKET